MLQQVSLQVGLLAEGGLTHVTLESREVTRSTKSDVALPGTVCPGRVCSSGASVGLTRWRMSADKGCKSRAVPL